MAGGISVDPELSPALPAGSSAAGASGRFVPGEGPTGLPAAPGVAFELWPLRAFTAVACFVAARVPETRLAAAFRRDPAACPDCSSAATDSVRRLF